MMSKRVMRSFTLCMAAIMTFLCVAMLVKTDDVYAAGWSYTANGSGVKITKYTGSGSSVTVPSKLDGKEVNAIGDRVFANNKEIELVTLPAQNIVLGKGVFNGCSNLTTVNNSQYVTEIGTGCFAACSKLSSYTFSNSVQVLGDSTFQGTALTEVFLPSSVRSLQMKVFYNCASLKKVTISNPDCNFNLATDTFTGTNGLTIYAPEGSTAKEYAVLKGFNYVVYTGSGSSGGATDGEGSSSGGSADGDITGGDSVIESGGTEDCRHKNCKTKVVSTATCTQVGVKTYTCRNCGYVKTVTTGMTPHSYGDYVTDINATETSDGVKSRYCTYCNHRSYITIIPATGSKVEPLKNGLVCEDGVWNYYKDGIIDKTYKGVVINDLGMWYVANGTIDWSYTGLAKYGELTCYIKDGAVNSSYTGLINVSDEWVYITDGVVNTYYCGLVNNEYGWWYVANGTVDWTYTNLVQVDGVWWYVCNGGIDFGYTGLYENEYGWWYIREGKVTDEYCGLVNNENGWWYVLYGRIDWEFTGLIENEHGWWYVRNGGIDFTYTGLVENEYGWWYVVNSGIDFNYTGLATNAYGTWNVINGKVVF